MGETKEIELNPATEIEMKQEEAWEQLKNKRVHWFTFRAKDQSYYRSFVEITGNNTRTIFGIIYRDWNAYDRYKPDYLAFKNSLRKYSH